MSEKLDLFEMTIKRGLENHELPMEENAWASFEAKLNNYTTTNSTQTSSFLPKFALAAAMLTGIAFFINKSVQTIEMQEDVVHLESVKPQKSNNIASEKLVTDHAANSNDNEPDTPTSAEDIQSTTNENSVINEAKIETKSAPGILNNNEKERMNRINQKLQEAADDNTELRKPLKKRSTTRYLGKSFNLGALKTFSPNNDGKDDTFLPSSLQEGDVFEMIISDEAGNLIFKSNEVAKPWKGNDFSGKDLEDGRYSWEVVLQKDKKKEIFKGTVRLDR